MLGTGVTKLQYLIGKKHVDHLEQAESITLSLSCTFTSFHELQEVILSRLYFCDFKEM